MDRTIILLAHDIFKTVDHILFYFVAGERVEGEEEDWDYEIPEDIYDDDEYDTTEDDDTTEGVEDDAYDTEGIFDNGDEGKQDDEGLLEP